MQSFEFDESTIHVSVCVVKKANALFLCKSKTLCTVS